MGGFLPPLVIPAKAGTQSGTRCTQWLWAPAFAGVTVKAGLGSFPECRLLARNAQKLTGRFRHHKPNGRKLPSLKKSAI
jgi:hypothetical protein